MAGECHWALNWAKIIMRSVDAVSERQRCELQSHCHSCKRSELQPRCHGTAYCRHSREKVRSTKPDDRRKMSPTGTAGEWCATLVLQLTSSTEPTSSAALPRSAPYLCEPQKRLEKILEKIGTSIVKEEEMDNRPIWFDMDTKEFISTKARFTKEVETIDDIISGLFFLQGLTKFIYVTRDNYSFKKGKNENSSRRK